MASAEEEQGGGAAEYSFEVSFQERLQGREGEVHQEYKELGEFELLEQAAEELSFSSNSSFVMKVRRIRFQKITGSRVSPFVTIHRVPGCVKAVTLLRG